MNSQARRHPEPRQASAPVRGGAQLARGLALLPLLLHSALAQQLPSAVAPASAPRQLLTVGDFSSGYNREIWWMSIWVIIAAVLIFVGVSWALFYTVAKFREDKHDNEPDQFHGNNRLEILLIAVPVIVVTAISVTAARTMAIVNPMPANAMKVNVTGAQFWWAFQYPDSPAATGGSVVNGNELVIPTGRQIALTITAKDVIHAFWAPNLGGQRDAIPGSTKTWQIDTQTPGIYQGNCAVLCGASHANMRFKVIALEPAQYNTFMAAAQAYRAPAPTTPALQNGYNIFMQGQPSTGTLACASCHRVQGTPANGAVGPDLSFFGSRNTLGAGTWQGQAAHDHLTAWIRNSAAVKPGALMPPYKNISDSDLADVEAYIRSLQLPADAAYWGKVPTR